MSRLGRDELAESVRETKARWTGIYTMSDDEQKAVGKGLAEADRGVFVPDELISKADERYD